MSKNYMSEVAKMLGVELGEEFDVRKFDIRSASTSPYKLADNGMVDCEGKVCDVLFRGVIAGRCEIIKKPWKPQTDDKYYYIEATLDCNHIDVWQEIWKNTTVDMERYAVGNFFKTREEASNSVNAYCKYLNNVVADLSWHNSK